MVCTQGQRTKEPSTVILISIICDWGLWEWEGEKFYVYTKLCTKKDILFSLVIF